MLYYIILCNILYNHALYYAYYNVLYYAVYCLHCFTTLHYFTLYNFTLHDTVYYILLCYITYITLVCHADFSHTLLRTCTFPSFCVAAASALIQCSFPPFNSHSQSYLPPGWFLCLLLGWLSCVHLPPAFSLLLLSLGNLEPPQNSVAAVRPLLVLRVSGNPEPQWGPWKPWSAAVCSGSCRALCSSLVFLA